MEDEENKQKITRGAHVKYDPKIHDDKAFTYFARGYTNALIAEKFKISPRTMDNWIAKYPTFQEAVIDGRRVSNSKNELKLWKISEGFYKEVEEPFVIKGKIEYAKYKKYFPPNFPALRFLMTNRMPQDYRDKVEETQEKETETQIEIVVKKANNE